MLQDVAHGQHHGTSGRQDTKQQTVMSKTRAPPVRPVAPRRHNPLADDISSSGLLRTKPSTGKRKSRSDDEVQGDGYVDARSSRKILSIAQDLADEDDQDRKVAAKAAAPNAAFAIDSRFGFEDEENDDPQGQYDDEEEWLPDENVETEDVDPDDMAVYNKFLTKDEMLAGAAPSLAGLSTDNKRESLPEDPDGQQEGQTTNLADLILQRIAEKEAREGALSSDHPIIHSGGHPSDAVEIPAKVADVFQKCALILSRYKSGPLPKPFKVLPTLPSWPSLLSMTQPQNWTPHAVLAATKIFISSSPPNAQHFVSTVLLDAVKDDIHETKKLNVHLYAALKKALYKPAAFFKGLLFPLVIDGCTLREAHIVSSVLARVSVPVLHSAAALLRLCEIAAEQSSVSSESAGATNIFIRVLLEKKYALPFKAVDALVFHFLRFRGSKEERQLSASEAKLPVLWHQTLLVFAQRYKNDITEDQREALLDLLLARGHREIGPEVRRELLAGRGRGIVEEPKMNGETIAYDGDDTMDMN